MTDKIKIENSNIKINPTEKSILSTPVNKIMEKGNELKTALENYDLDSYVKNNTSFNMQDINIEETLTNSNYDSLKNLTDKYKNIETDVYKVTNYDDIVDTDKDTGNLFWKTTTGLNGERISYSSMHKYSNGEVVYKDADGNVVKRINEDGTVTIGNKIVNKDGTVTNGLGYKLLEDGSYYSEHRDGSSVRKFSDGTEVEYDSDGNILKLTYKDETIKYGNDTITKSKSTDTGYEQTTYNSDGTYKEQKYEPNSSTNYTTTYYDKNGNQTNTTKTYKETGQYGDHIVVESGGKKYYYSADGKTLEYSEETNNRATTTTKYDESGKPVTTENTNSDGSTTTTINGQKHKDVDSNGNTTIYDDKGNKDYVEKADGNRIEYYENGQVEYETKSDGSAIGYDEQGNVNYEKNPDGSAHYINSDGSEEWVSADGTVTYIGLDGEKHSY